MKVDLSSVKVDIESGIGVGGVYPFIVVCYDNEIVNELHKTKAVHGGEEEIKFEETFDLDLQMEEKSRNADGRTPPKYLTFFIYDTGTEGIPSLGSAGVLLDTVREQGVAKGDFPIVNGTGVLKLNVASKENQNSSWIHSGGAKIAGVVGAGALAAGVAAMVVGNKRKKNKKAANPTDKEQLHDEHHDELDDGPDPTNPNHTG